MTSDFTDLTKTHPIILPNGKVHDGTVFLGRVIDHPRMTIGDFTYYSDFDPPDEDREYAGRIAPYLFENSLETLSIGRFCQIAHGVKFITASANHAMGGVSTFPFPVFDPAEMSNYQPDQRDTRVGHDCWIGYGAIICPGADIGNGAIVGAGAVVRGRIPDYSVVIGNPANVVRMRFNEATIATLNRIAWWNWPVEKITRLQSEIQRADISALEQA